MINFNEDVLAISQTKPVVVQFTADWCGPCRIIKPILRNVQKKRDDFNLVFVNVDDEAELSIKYRVRGIPTILMFHNGNPIDQYWGGPSVNRFNNWLDGLLTTREVNGVNKAK